METIIIDAYNLMHKVGELKHLLKQSQDIAVDTMVAKLQNHFFNSRVKVILVYDGYGKNKHDRNIDVKFSKTDITQSYESADQFIKHMIEKVRNKKLVKVVSTDNEITWYAKDCGCRVQTSESFWGELKDKKIRQIEAEQESKEKPDVVTRSEFEFMLKQFTKK
jgi:predicted RNA-binding protein with PIN domain